jgi:hypothetical protein
MAGDWEPVKRPPASTDASDWGKVEGTGEPGQGGVLGNVGTDDPYGEIKNVGTSGIKMGLGAPGFAGDTLDLIDTMKAGVKSVFSDKTTKQIKAEQAAESDKEAKGTFEKMKAQGKPWWMSQEDWDAKMKAGAPEGHYAPTTQDLYEKFVKPTLGEYKPVTNWGKTGSAFIQAAGPGVASKFKAGTGVARVALGAPTLAERAVTLGQAVKPIALTGSGGVASELVGRHTDNPFWTAVPGLVTPLGIEGALATRRAITGPITNEARTRAAAERYGKNIREAEPHEPNAVPNALSRAREALGNLPDWLKDRDEATPTIGELSQSRGLALGERAAEKSDPAGTGAQLGERQAARMAAQQEAGRSTTDPNATGMEVKDTLGLGAAELDERINKALPKTSDIDEIGGGIRNPLAEAQTKAEAARTKLYDNMEREFGSQWLKIPGLKERAEALMKHVEGFEPEAQTTKHIDLAREMPNEVQFSQLRVYLKSLNNFIANNRSSTTEGMREQVQRAQALRSAVWDDLHGAVKNRLESEFGKEGERGANAEAAMEARLTEMREAFMNGVAEPQGPKVPLSLAGVAALKEANAAQKALGTTFREGVVGDLLKQDKWGQAWNVKDAYVPKKAFPDGPDGGNVTRAVLEAGGPDVLPAIKEAVISSLREVMDKNHLDPAALDKWKQKKGPALKAIDEVEPGFSKRFDNLANTHSELARSFLGAEDVQTAQAVMGKLLRDKINGPSKLNALLNDAGHDPAVIEGLKKLALDHMYETAGNNPLGFGQKLAGQLHDYRPALTKIFGAEHMPVLESLIKDAASQQQHARFSNQSSPGSPTQFYTKLGESLQPVTPPSLGARIGLSSGFGGLAGLAGYGGGMLAGLQHPGAMISAAGTAITLGTLGYLGSKLKAHGINGVQDAYRAGMVDPKLGMRMLQYAAEGPGSQRWWQRVGPMVLASPYVVQPGQQQLDERKRKGHAAGGAVKAKCDHAACAARLVSQADKIRRRHARHTKVLLNAPDDAVAKALAIAGRGL